MNNYTEFNFKIQPLEPWNEILMAELIEIGFDSFTEELEGILAYIPTAVSYTHLDVYKRQELLLKPLQEAILSF